MTSKAVNPHTWKYLFSTCNLFFFILLPNTTTITYVGGLTPWYQEPQYWVCINAFPTVYVLRSQRRKREKRKHKNSAIMVLCEGNPLGTGGNLSGVPTKGHLCGYSFHVSSSSCFFGGLCCGPSLKCRTLSYITVIVVQIAV